MIKRLKKPLAVLCALFVALSLAGCADTSWAVKVDGTKVPSGVYITFLISARNSVLNNSTSSSSSSAAASSDALSLNTSSAASSSSADPWSQKISGQNAYAWAIDQAKKSAETVAYVENQCAKKKITLTSSETSYAEQLGEQYESGYTVYSSNGVSSASLQRVFKYYYLSSKLFDSYYSDNGSKAVPATQLKDYFSKNYVQIKQVFFSLYDDEGNQLAAAKAQKKKAQADNVAAQLKADPSKLSALIKQYNEDTGETSDGYVFNKDAQYLQVFKDAAFAMKAGEIRVVQSTQGYHVMYKVALDPNGSAFTSNKSDVLHTMKDTEFNNMLLNDLKSAKVEVNDSAINKYDPKNLKDQ